MMPRPLASNNPFNTGSARWDRKMLPFSMVSTAFSHAEIRLDERCPAPLLGHSRCGLLFECRPHDLAPGLCVGVFIRPQELGVAVEPQRDAVPVLGRQPQAALTR